MNVPRCASAVGVTNSFLTAAVLLMQACHAYCCCSYICICGATCPCNAPAGALQIHLDLGNRPLAVRQRVRSRLNGQAELLHGFIKWDLFQCRASTSIEMAIHLNVFSLCNSYAPGSAPILV
jgi:hypothetical protein